MNTKQPDWRNTLYQFHNIAVEKHKLKPQEIAVFTALFSKVKKGHVCISNSELMKKCGISNRKAFRKSRDRLVEAKIITIVKKGSVYTEPTQYRLKMMGKPKITEQKVD